MGKNKKQVAEWVDSPLLLLGHAEVLRHALAYQTEITGLRTGIDTLRGHASNHDRQLKVLQGQILLLERQVRDVTRERIKEKERADRAEAFIKSAGLRLS